MPDAPFPPWRRPSFVELFCNRAGIVGENTGPSADVDFASFAVGREPLREPEQAEQSQRGCRNLPEAALIEVVVLSDLRC